MGRHVDVLLHGNGFSKSGHGLPVQHHTPHHWNMHWVTVVQSDTWQRKTSITFTCSIYLSLLDPLLTSAVEPTITLDHKSWHLPTNRWHQPFDYKKREFDASLLLSYFILRRSHQWNASVKSNHASTFISYVYVLQHPSSFSCTWSRLSSFLPPDVLWWSSPSVALCYQLLCLDASLPLIPLPRL